MGCDIHLWVEQREADGKWHRVVTVPEPYRDPWLVKSAAEHKRGTPMSGYYRLGTLRRWFDDRNYTAFGILAGVRSSEFPTIAEPRGWTEDLSDDLRKLFKAAENWEEPDESNLEEQVRRQIWKADRRKLSYEDWLLDQGYRIPEGDVSPGDHSESWLTLKELLDYDWEGPSYMQGTLDWDTWATREKNGGQVGLPDSWCGWTSAPTVTEAEARKLLKSGKHDKPYVQARWKVLPREAAGGLYTRLIPALQSLGGDPEDVRIVFNFDS